MDILRFLFYAFLLYLAFRLVFDFIIPMYRTTKRIRKGFREMQDQMNQQHARQFAEEKPSTQNQDNHKGRGGLGEYIDFEEIKD